MFCVLFVHIYMSNKLTNSVTTIILCSFYESYMYLVQPVLKSHYEYLCNITVDCIKVQSKPLFPPSRLCVHVFVRAACVTLQRFIPLIDPDASTH